MAGFGQVAVYHGDALIDRDALLHMRQHDRITFVAALKAAGLSKIGERARFETELLSKSKAATGGDFAAAPERMPAPPSSEGHHSIDAAPDVLSVVRAHGGDLLALRTMVVSDHAAFTACLPDLGLRKLGQRVEFEQRLLAMRPAALSVPASPVESMKNGPRINYVVRKLGVCQTAGATTTVFCGSTIATAHDVQLISTSSFTTSKAVAFPTSTPVWVTVVGIVHSKHRPTPFPTLRPPWSGCNL